MPATPVNKGKVRATPAPKKQKVNHGDHAPATLTAVQVAPSQFDFVLKESEMSENAFVEDLDIDLFDPDISSQALNVQDQPRIQGLGAQRNGVAGMTNSYMGLPPSAMIGQSGFSGSYVNLAMPEENVYEAPECEDPAVKYVLSPTIPLFFYKQKKSFKKNGTTVKYSTCVLEKSYYNKVTKKEGALTIDVPMKSLILLHKAVLELLQEMASGVE